MSTWLNNLIRRRKQRMHKQEVLNKIWNKLRDAINSATSPEDLWPIMLELRAAIDMGKDLENEQFSETYKRLFGSGKERPIQFSDILKEMQELYLKKNHDYGNSFSETIQEFGFTPAIARINDKLKRVKQMVGREPMQVKESMRDNLIDIANYCILTIIELDNQNK